MGIIKKISMQLAQIAGRPPITSIFNAINNKYGGFILAYHNPLPQSVESHFKAMKGLKAVLLDEIVSRIKKGYSTKGLYAVTVDDGIGIAVRNLSKIAKKKNIPITFYLPTAYLDSGKAYWFHRLEDIFKKTISGVINYKGTDFDFSCLKAKEMLLKLTLYSFLKLQPSEAEVRTDEFIEKCVINGIIDADICLGQSPISWDEVRQFSGDKLISFESHSVRHSNLAVLSEKEIELELVESINKIEHFTGKRCRHFCYPFGSKDEIGKIAPLVCKKFAVSAVTLQRGRLDNSSLWYLPRIPLYDKDSQQVVAFKLALTKSLKNNRSLE